MAPTLGLVSLMVEDWYEAVDFYHELLGLELLWSDERRGRARLRATPGVVLEIVSGGWGSEAPKSPRESPFSLCLRVADLGRTVQELEFRGVWLLEEPEGGLAAIADPEGNRLYLYEGDEAPEAGNSY